MRNRLAIVLLAAQVLALMACASVSDADPLAVVRSMRVSDVEDDTASDSYRIVSAEITTTGMGTELNLGFDISNANGTAFSPASAVTFDDGTSVTCEVDDLRRTPHLVDTTTSWGFACDGDIPEGARTARIVVTDSYR